MSATAAELIHSDSGTPGFYYPHKCEKLVISQDEIGAQVLVCENCGQKV